MTGATLTSASGGGPGSAAALAALLVAVPLVLGVLLGKALRSWRRGIAVGMLATAGLTLATVELLPQVGVWDTVAVGALVVVGLLWSGAGFDARGALALVASTAFALVALELAARWWLPPASRLPDPGRAALLFDRAAWDAGCSVLYDAASVDDDVHVLRRVAPNEKTRQHPPLVVHLGDSMTYGEGVGAEETFVALLDARQPAVVHRNYGVWAVGTDFQYLLLQRILDEHSPAMIVLHVYAGNDIHDIDRPYACCDAGPLLDYDADGPVARCDPASWSIPLAMRLGRSPPPYVLRVASHWSHAARHLAAAFSRLVSRLEPRADFIRAEGEANELGWTHFTQILAAMRNELPPNVELVVHLLPARRALEAADPTIVAADRARRRAARIAADLGIRTLDACDVLAAAVKRDGTRRYFRDAHDIHFSAEGHRLIADWLERELGSEG